MADMAAEGLVIATPVRRILAFVIDALIGLAINMGLGVIYLSVGVDDRTIIALFLVTTAIYNIGFVVARSATLGKTVMGIYIGDREGRAVTPDTAILRYLVIGVPSALGVVSVPLSFAAFGLTVVSFSLLLMDPQRRTIHDRIAGTLVLAGTPRPRTSLGSGPTPRW
jgi:uncharacterized RDD family membrane protein YckC